MTPPLAASCRAAPMLSGRSDPSIVAYPVPSARSFRSTRTTTVQSWRIVLAAEGVRAKLAERLGAQRGDGTMVGIGCVRVELVLLRGEQRRHVSVHRSDDGGAVRGVEVAVEMDVPVALVDGSDWRSR